MNSAQWLKPVDAARRLEMSTKELYRLIDEGAIAGYRFGRVIRLRTADVDDYLRRRGEGR